MKKWYIIREDNSNELFHYGIKGLLIQLICYKSIQ